MGTRTLALATAFALLLAVPMVPANASPVNDIWTVYYDCGMHWMGEKYRGCDSTGYNTGVTTGATFKLISSCQCEGTTCTDTWYRWNGSTWIQIAGEPAPEC
ncbi:MAG TPA: hypothetical protein VHW00_06805 [Thermoanaerobaculia bacterium]|nr:hypothetical protein [Thermoanaerobaculia bacterium]